MILLLIGILNPSIKIHWNEIKLLLNASKTFHLLGIASSFADRIDRIVIAWFLPLEVLGKYAVGTSFISFLRFLPEAISRWVISGQNLPIFRKSPKLMPVYIFLTAGIILLGSILTQILVKTLFGTEWTLPLLVLIIFSAQEIARGLYQIYLSKVIDTAKQRLVRDSSLILIVSTPLLSFVGAKSIGVYGVPLGMLISYMSVNIFFKDFHRKSNSHVH
jgi:O-antigen/teichoic acid export membrane protein